MGLTVGPWTHSQIAIKGGPVLFRETVDWLDEHLAGDDGPARSAPVPSVTGSGEWRDLPAWPPRSTRRVLHPQPGGGLADSPPPLRRRPASPRPGRTHSDLGGPILRNGSAGYQDDTALAARTDVLAFTGAR